MKKTFALLLAVIMLLSLGMTAFADEATGEGKITINNPVNDQIYTIYRILYIESYNATSDAYAYKAESAWETWLKTQTTYVSFDDQGYVTWVEGADAAAFAKAAIAYAKENNITSDGTRTVGANETSIEFTNLKLGYYLVDTTLGTLCGLDTTNPNATIQEKNAAPTIDKQVEEDSKTEDAWGKNNDADFNQTVNFKITVTAKKGAENYVVHDQMSAGLTLDRNSFKVMVGETELTAGTDYKVVSSVDAKVVHSHLDGRNIVIDGICTFDIEFTQAYLDTITADTTIVITYSAAVNEDAVVGLDGNPNKTWLDYGDETHVTSTPESETITYVWDLDVLKYANGDENIVLKDAQFVLLNKDKTKVAVVVDGKLTSWADVPTAGEDGTITWPENTVLTTGDNGKIEIDGLDSDTYYLREIKAPDGYNKLANDVEVVIEGAKKGEGDTLTYTTAVAKVENRSGTELPSTGAEGTTLFITFGSIVVLVAVVFMITRKKMSVYED